MNPNVERRLQVVVPEEGDVYGQIQKNLSETERLRNGQISNQIVFLRAYFKAGGIAVEKRNFRFAARHYVNAILNSHDLFAGLHLTGQPTVREVRTYFPDDFNQISAEDREKIVGFAVEWIEGLEPEEIADNVTKEELVAFVVPLIRFWLKLK